MSHAALPGVVLAFIITGHKDPLSLLIGAAIAGWLGALDARATDSPWDLLAATMATAGDEKYKKRKPASRKKIMLFGCFARCNRMTFGIL